MIIQCAITISEANHDFDMVFYGIQPVVSNAPIITGPLEMTDENKNMYTESWTVVVWAKIDKDDGETNGILSINELPT